MLSRSYRVYAARVAGGMHFDASPDPAFDLAWWAQKGPVVFTVLTTPIPLWLADCVVNELRRSCRDEREAGERTRWVLSQWGQGGSFNARSFQPQDAEGILLPGASETDMLKEAVAGRILLDDEIFRGLQGRFPSGQIGTLLRALVLDGKAGRAPAVGLDAFGQPRCNRCGERYRVVRTECPRCGGPCYLCLECSVLGESRSCQALYWFEPNNSPTVVPRLVQPSIAFPLTAAQQAAASEFSHLLSGGADEVLLWAVCGAGKTEVTFEAIGRAASAGQRILYAVPRRDVVFELAPRIEAAFPELTMVVLPGGGRAALDRADLAVATTHQVLRFYHAFDFVLLDEADAYPYAGSEMLYRAVQRARRPGGRMAYLTATPGRMLRERVGRAVVPVVRIPARYHGYPLAVPEIVQVRLSPPERRWEPPQSVLRFIGSSIQRGARVIVFVPTVQWAECVGHALANVPEGPRADFVHSRRADRKEIIEHFRAGTIRVMVSTTVLERGVTFPKTDVLVLHADHAIFDSGALVQMAGRAGRHASDPVGRVAFFVTRSSPDARAAVENITQMNVEAREKGFLNCGNETQ